MKQGSLSFIIMLLMSCGHAYCQDTTGLIAHWPMNGTPYDVTGKGHDGTIRNVTATAGKNGMPNTAYYFSGNDSSYISAHYKSDLNLSTFSICALVKPMGYYNGLCQSSIIFCRGQHQTSGTYALYFSDNYYDNDDCFAVDTSKNVFAIMAGSSFTPGSSWQYTPTITSNTWYCVIATFNGTNMKMYVNGMLKSTYPFSGTIGNSSDSIMIGRHALSAAGYPYWFNGAIDDIKLYKRALADSEISQYCTSAPLDTQRLRDTTNAISKQEVQYMINVFPNPTSGKFAVQLSRFEEGQMQLINMLGQTILQQKINTVNTELDISGQANGIYMLRIQLGANSYTTRIQKE